MTKISADLFPVFMEGFARSTVDDLSLIADGARRSHITHNEARSLDAGEMMLKRGFTSLCGATIRMRTARQSG